MGRRREAGRRFPSPAGRPGQGEQPPATACAGMGCGSQRARIRPPRGLSPRLMFAVLRSPGSFSQTHVRIMGLRAQAPASGEGSRRQVLHR